MGLGWAGNASHARRSIDVTLAKMSHRNATTKQAVRFRPTLRGGVLLGPPSAARLLGVPSASGMPSSPLLDGSLKSSRRGACRFNRHGICYTPPDIPSVPASARHRAVRPKPPPPGVIHGCGIIEFSSVVICITIIIMVYFSLSFAGDVTP